MIEIDGIVPIIPIPFHPDGDIHEEDLRRLVEYCVENRASAVCLPAYGSEFYKLLEKERAEVVRIAAEQSRGRIPVIGQANQGSPTAAIDLANCLMDAGADMISIAVPRTFGLSEQDVLRFFQATCRKIGSPVLIQDFNPGGATVGADFARRLHADCPNFRYLKLEEPMMGPKVRAILEATDGKVGVLEGWSGLYMIELLPCGICGVMPGVPLLRVMDRVYREYRRGHIAEAYAAFKEVAPFIVFTLQHLELFLHVEKRLLKAMGLIRSAYVREATIALDADTEAYAEWLISQVLPNVARPELVRSEA